MKLLGLLLFLLFSTAQAKDYTDNKQTKIVMQKLLKTKHFKQREVEKLFSHVKVQQSALNVFLPRKKNLQKKMSKKRRKKHVPQLGSWDRYSRLKINPSRVKQGVAFIHRYQTLFNAVEKRFGVPKEYIAAIIGIETVYGGNVGKYPVFDTLSTLAFEKNRRSKFFEKELLQFLYLSKTERFNPRNVKGSYAGAIGLGQFMPSNYKAYGVDFNNDGRITLQKAEDAIASIANYLKKNGWRKGEPVATRVKYVGIRFSRYKTGYTHLYDRKQLKGIRPYTPWNYHQKVRLIKLEKKAYDALWYGAKNFFVITRYNHSSYYAMSVHQLAQKIKQGLKDEN
jgi:membrane-bound lytic murein transglycosylase B